MNKQELIAEVAEKTDLTRTDTAKVLEAVLSAIVDELKEGGDVRLLNFGTFSVSHRAAKEAHNPRTRTPIKVPASKHPKFRAGKAFKKTVNV